MLTKAKKGKADKKAKQPMRIHSLVIIVCIILAAALMTWILPAGEYDRYENAQGKLVVTLPLIIILKRILQPLAMSFWLFQKDFRKPPVLFSWF